MPNWQALLNEVESTGSTHDVIRRKYLRRLYKKTGRNVILYYSGWLQKGDMGVGGFNISDADKNGFMAVIHGMDRTKGLDLILHTPGGDIAATESLVDYLRSMFGSNIRAIVPQIAMSAGTMIALSCREIIMGKHSSLGPIDPQLGNGIAAHGIIEEFEQAKADLKENLALAHIWQPIIAKYSPTVIGECQKAIKWSETIVKRWLIEGMFRDKQDPDAAAQSVVDDLCSHSITLSHSRHISLKRAQELNLTVIPLESDQGLQDAILSVHHACIHTLTRTPVIKLIENHRGVGFISAFAPQAP